MIEHFEKAASDIDPVRAWQVGMDGPNVNLSFFKQLNDQRLENHYPALSNLGTCGLHIIHEGFQTGAKATN